MKNFLLGIFYRGIVLPISLILISLSIVCRPIYWIITGRNCFEDLIEFIHYKTKLDEYLPKKKI